MYRGSVTSKKNIYYNTSTVIKEEVIEEKPKATLITNAQTIKDSMNFNNNNEVEINFSINLD